MKLYNIVKVYTSTVGTGTVTLGSAVPSFITFATAGVINGSTVSYAIEDGNNREVGTGTYTSGAETLTRSVVTSTNSNNAITLSGNAVVFITGLAADLSSDTAATANTLVIRNGSGNFALGAPTSGTLTNCTGLPISSGVSGLGANVATFLATPSSANLAGAVTDETGSGALVFANTPTLVTPLLGTPTSGTLTNCTGLPISTGVSGLAANVATFLGTPSSSNLAAAVTDETGTGALVFANTPSLVTPAIGSGGFTLAGSSSGTTTVAASAAASGTITIPAATDTLVGKATTDTFTNKTFDTAGTGNVLRINGTQVSAVTGSGSVVLATSPTLVTPLLGTPTSGTLTNCTGLPISSGVSGLGTGVATFLATPSSANLASAVTDETGTGALVFGTSPTIATPTITTSATVPLVIGGTGTTSSLTLRSTSGVGTTGADIIFQTGNNGASEIMRLLNGGNVGIGTPSPGVALDVQRTSADAQIRAYTGTVDLRLWAYHAGAGVVGTNSAHPLIFATNGLSERMRIDSSGNVGIGTSSPSWQTTVYGTGQNTALLTDAGSKSASLFVGSSNGTTGAGGAVLFGGVTINGVTSQWAIKSIMTSTAASGTADLAFATRAGTGDTSLTERMRIDASGNVLIGTTSVSGILTVSGAGTSTIFSAAHTGSGGSLKFIGTGATTVDLAADVTLFKVTGYGNTTIYADTSGNKVGIGTASPAASAKLEIAGTTGALLVPRLTTTERNALTAVNGMIIYNTTDNQMQGYINGAWAAM